MKVVKFDEWDLVGYTSLGFVFQHREFADEIQILKRAKVVLTKDVVLFINVDGQPVVSPSRATSRDNLTSVPQYQEFISASQSKVSIA